MLPWIYLCLAGCFEIFWPLGLKISQQPDRRLLGLAMAVMGMAVSGFLLWLAQRDIPIGTAYAVWTGIGAVGTFVVGIAFFKDPATAARMVGVGLIAAGIITLKVASAGEH